MGTESVSSVGVLVSPPLPHLSSLPHFSRLTPTGQGRCSPNASLCTANNICLTAVVSSFTSFKATGVLNTPPNNHDSLSNLDLQTQS